MRNKYLHTGRRGVGYGLIVSITLGLWWVMPQTLEAASLFASGFEDVPEFSEWSEVDTETWDVITAGSGHHAGVAHAIARGGSASSTDRALVKEFSTTGHEAIAVKFWYRQSGLEADDTVSVSWHDGATWIMLATFAGATGSGDDIATWTEYTASLPTGADDNPSLKIRFVGNLGQANDEFRLDDVVITGEAIPAEEEPVEEEPVEEEPTDETTGTSTDTTEEKETATTTEETPEISKENVKEGKTSSGTKVGQRGRNAATSTGRVLGVATNSVETCGRYLRDYLGFEKPATRYEILKLQLFLASQKIYTSHNGISIFDQETFKNVRVLQARYQKDILEPWVAAGRMPAPTPTGYVFLTTRHTINNLVCPGSEMKPLIP